MHSRKVYHHNIRNEFTRYIKTSTRQVKHILIHINIYHYRWL